MISTGPIQASSQGIVILPDTIRAVLLERRSSGDGSISLACAGIAITIWITFATASFKDKIGNPAPKTEMAFLFAGIIFSFASIFWLFRYWRNRKRSSVDSIVKELEERAASRGTALVRK